MIVDDDIIEIGKFQKTHALKGELNALLDVEEDFLTDGNPVVVSIDGINVPFFAESVRPKGVTSFLVKLKGVDNVEEADKFVNKLIYGLRKDLLNYFDTPEEEYFASNDLIGYNVVDKDHGLIGELVDIDDSTINTLMVIERKSGQTVYVPMAEEMIDSIDDEREEIIVCLPEGLINLNG